MSWTVLTSWPRSSRLSRFGTDSSSRRRMGDESLYVFERAQRQCLIHGGKVVEELSQRPSMFEVIDQRPNRHAGTHEDRCASEYLWIRMNAGNLLHERSPNG